MMKSYFTNDGTYGSADDGKIVILNTENFTEDDWDDLEECSDSIRMALAQEIERERNA